MEIAEKLKSEIAEANEAYRIGRPVMDDLSYDELLEQYRELVPAEEYEAFARTLHEKSGKVRLPYLLGSLTKLKCQEPESIAKFAAKYAPDRIHISAKVDGISACLVYKAGRLVHAAATGSSANRSTTRSASSKAWWRSFRFPSRRTWRYAASW